jgi:hypothetical protein
MPGTQWARLRRVAECGLRLGAWYPVVGLTAGEVQVRVHGKLARVPRTLLELRAAPPGEWTVVRGPLNALRVPAGARDGYLVCPNCRSRQSLPDDGRGTERCGRCNAAFPVAWDRIGAATPNALAEDRRMTRRRIGSERRTGGTRRASAGRRVTPGSWPAERRVAVRRRRLEQRSGLERRLVGERRQRAVRW